MVKYYFFSFLNHIFKILGFFLLEKKRKVIMVCDNKIQFLYIYIYIIDDDLGWIFICNSRNPFKWVGTIFSLKSFYICIRQGTMFEVLIYKNMGFEHGGGGVGKGPKMTKC
jgi:hypothetical protein